MKRKELLIFDFDGTIADTKSVYYKSISDELKNYGFKEKDVDKAIDVGLSLRKTLGKLGLSFIVSWFLHKRIMKRVKRYANNVKKCRDVDSIKRLKCQKILITNSLKEFALPILRHLKLRKSFKEIYGADDFDDKEEFIKNYLRNNKVDKKNCFYIGDRAADVRLAKKAGIKSIIVTGKCSWDSRKEVLKQNPDFVVGDIKNLSEIFECFKNEILDSHRKSNFRDAQKCEY